MGCGLKWRGKGALCCFLSATRFAQNAQLDTMINVLSLLVCALFLKSYNLATICHLQPPESGLLLSNFPASFFFFFTSVHPMTRISQQVFCVFIQTFLVKRAQWASLLFSTPPSRRCNNLTEPHRESLVRLARTNVLYAALAPCGNKSERENIFVKISSLLKCKRCFGDVKRKHWQCLCDARHVSTH